MLNPLKRDMKATRLFLQFERKTANPNMPNLDRDADQRLRVNVSHHTVPWQDSPASGRNDTDTDLMHDLATQ